MKVGVISATPSGSQRQAAPGRRASTSALIDRGPGFSEAAARGRAARA